MVGGAHPVASITSEVALAAAAGRLDGHRPDLLGVVLAHTPDGRVRDGLAAARRITGAAQAAEELGCGARAMAYDTVPFALWVAARHLDDYPAAVGACVAAGGDVDTTCAIAGGVVAAHTGVAGIPPEWLAAREPLPTWL